MPFGWSQEIGSDSSVEQIEEPVSATEGVAHVVEVDFGNPDSVASARHRVSAQGGSRAEEMFDALGWLYARPVLNTGMTALARLVVMYAGTSVVMSYHSHAAGDFETVGRPMAIALSLTSFTLQLVNKPLNAFLAKPETVLGKAFRWFIVDFGFYSVDMATGFATGLYEPTFMGFVMGAAFSGAKGMAAQALADLANANGEKYLKARATTQREVNKIRFRADVLTVAISGITTAFTIATNAVPKIGWPLLVVSGLTGAVAYINVERRLGRKPWSEIRESLLSPCRTLFQGISYLGYRGVY